MPTQAEHTVVRISLRSMFILTTSLALAAVLFGPEYRELDDAETRSLLYATLCFVVGMLVSAFYFVRRRKKLWMRSQPILLQLPVRSTARTLFAQWILVLLVVPGNLDNSFRQWSRTSETFFGYLFHYGSPLLYGTLIAYFFLFFCTEGFSDTIDIGADGIVAFNKFYTWNSSEFRRMQWSPDGEKLHIQVHALATQKIPVPPHQREAVDAILEHYYLPARTATDQT